MGRHVDAFDAGAERKAPSVGWEIARAVGLVSLVVVVVGSAIIAASGEFGIGYRAAQLVPQPVRDFFKQETLIPAPPNLGQKARDAIAAAAPAPEKSSGGRRGLFAIGDSESTVLRIEGEPTRRAGNVWYYGESQVTFLGGRVAGWNNSSSRPLRVR